MRIIIYVASARSQFAYCEHNMPLTPSGIPIDERHVICSIIINEN